MRLDPSNMVDYLRRLREQHDVTQAELADKIKVHRMTISKLETGVHKLTVDNLVDITHALGYEVEITVRQLG